MSRNLADADVGAIVRLLARLPLIEGGHIACKRALMDGLCALVEADGWLWTLTQMDAQRGAPVSLGILHGGLTEQQVAGWIEMNHSLTRRPPEHPRLVAEVKRGVHFTRSRDQLVDDETWYNHPTIQQYRLERGIDHSMHSIFPLVEGQFSGVGLYRHVGRPAFTPRQRKIAHIVLAEVDWLHCAELPSADSQHVVKLTSRQRNVLVLLLEGRSRAEIASSFNISTHTVHDHTKAIYRQFGVSSQLQLIQRFKQGDGGDLPSPSMG